MKFILLIEFGIYKMINLPFMKIYLLTISLILGNFLYAQDSDLQWIKVEGNSFVDESGLEVTFQGLNASDPDKLEKDGQWNQRYLNEVKSWGANLVRFPIHPRAWRSRGKEEYIKLIDKGVSMAKTAGLYVVLDWHSIGNLRTEIFQRDGYITTQAETFNFWRDMSVQYGDDPTVAFFELFNEPTTASEKFGKISWQQWKSTMEELIALIRANGAKNIPLVAGFNWAYELSNVADHPIQADGIGYVSHPYPQKRKKPWEAKWEADWGYVADKYPVILTEIGFCGEGEKGAHIPVIDDGQYPKVILDYAAKKGISYVVWVFDPRWSPMLIEDWSFKPTKAGAVWKELMKKN